jgi:hypothetical protein
MMGTHLPDLLEESARSVVACIQDLFRRGKVSYIYVNDGMAIKLHTLSFLVMTQEHRMSLLQLLLFLAQFLE